MTDEQLAIISQITLKLAELGHELRFKTPISVGPLVTTFRFESKGVSKVKQIASLSQDVAMALGVEDVLIQRLPGESYIGITIPNKNASMVQWRDLVGAAAQSSAKLPLLFGVDSLGKPFIDDLTTLPHLLVAGSTGGGKSVLLRSLLATLMYYKTPDEVQFIISDTKQVEFGHFVASQFLLFEPCNSVYQTLERMDWISDEIDRRLKLFKFHEVHNIHEYHTKQAKLSYIVLVIDELASLVGSEKKGESNLAEKKLSRIVQLSRAAGVYVVAATQRPSVNVVAGSIKANFPARLTFRLPSEADSRTVLGTGGAEHLLSRGDMLYQSPNRQSIIRLHSAYASDQDIHGCLEAASLKTQYQESRR